jgi:hypothetical protein
MEIDEWYEERIVKPKQEWARVSQEAKLNKLRKRMSQRDIERELRIAELGGNSVEVFFGSPLSEEVRKLRKEVEWDLKYPKRKEKKTPIRRMPKGFKEKRGAKRSKEQFIYGILMGCKTRAKAKGIPFNLELKQITIPDACPVLGIPLYWGSKQSDNTPSIDRLVPEKGYVIDNCHVISMKANRLKNNATKEELMAILRYVSGESLE